MIQLRTKKDIKKNNIIYILLILSLSSLLYLVIVRRDSHRKFCSLGLLSRQNAFFINFVLILSLFKKIRNTKYFSYLILNCLINCLFIFAFCIQQFSTIFDYFFVEHKFLPFIFVFYYLFIDSNIIPSNKIYIGFIYVFVYSFISLIAFENELFPYRDDLDKFKNNYQNSYHIIIIFLFLVIILNVFIVSYFLLKFKNNNVVIELQKIK
ncbi:hypothetical protein ['Camptotheca acuminata' phytoplasma]|uniref:hypothetical protein n=1 Tax='Camptotheca acuminata' phytoplasma TaxID=3239192 RepID=UPI003519DEBF